MISRQRQWQIDNRDRIAAHRDLGRALRDGRVKPAVRCEECGKRVKLEAHHHKGYGVEHRLDVVWLCYRCHDKAHGRIRNGTGLVRIDKDLLSVLSDMTRGRVAENGGRPVSLAATVNRVLRQALK